MFSTRNLPEIAELYRKLGFEDEYDSLRFMGTSAESTFEKSYCTTAMKPSDISAIARFDTEYLEQIEPWF